MPDMLDMALAESNTGPNCGTGPGRLPTSKFPVYSTTLEATIPAGELSSNEVEFEAQRDTLFNGLEVHTNGAEATPVYFSSEYCNTKILVDVHTTVFGPCCPRKPIFLMGVKDNKRLTFRAKTDTAPVNPVIVRFTVYGFQGRGCCG